MGFNLYRICQIHYLLLKNVLLVMWRSQKVKYDTRGVTGLTLRGDITVSS